MADKRIAVRGSLWLKEVTCTRIASPDPVGACNELRRMRLATIYVGNVAVHVSPFCDCYVNGGRTCPVSEPGKRAVVTGTYQFDPETWKGAPEDAPVRHELRDVEICTE